MWNHLTMFMKQSQPFSGFHINIKMLRNMPVPVEYANEFKFKILVVDLASLSSSYYNVTNGILRFHYYHIIRIFCEATPLKLLKRGYRRSYVPN